MISVCDIVEYGRDSFDQGPQTWRVTHHLKRVEDHLDAWEPKDIAEQITKDVCLRFREKDRKWRKKHKLPHARRYRLVYCRPSEATHLELVAVCGALAPIGECKKVGVVEWDREMILRDRKDAIRWIKQMKGRFTDWDWE